MYTGKTRVDSRKDVRLDCDKSMIQPEEDEL